MTGFLLPDGRPQSATALYDDGGRMLARASRDFVPMAMGLDAEGNALVAGAFQEYGERNDSDFFAIKYSMMPASFLRGDCNGDGAVAGGVSDAVFLFQFLFQAGEAPSCLAACDADGDSSAGGQVTDAIYLLLHNFQGGPAPLPPFPACGAGPPGGLSCGIPGC